MKLSGDVTTYCSLAGVAPEQLEQRIGYQAGRLAQGYEVYALIDPVAADDFIWGDHTTYSGAWQMRRDIGEYVQRSDILRYEIYRQNGFDERAADAAFDRFIAAEVAKLNVRDGPDRIVKVRPAIRHDPTIFWRTQYPDSPTRGTPQWTIRRGKEKEFRLLAIVPPGGVLR